jgi:CelD/BcsL family acetyltransferase involved in cellulose biosynthesis
VDNLDVTLHTAADFAELAPEWQLLFAADLDATPFASPAWATAWWAHLCDKSRLWLIAVREAGQLVGLAPLVLRRRGPFRVLSELGRQPANYWHVLALPEEVVPKLVEL